MHILSAPAPAGLLKNSRIDIHDKCIIKKTSVKTLKTLKLHLLYYCMHVYIYIQYMFAAVPTTHNPYFAEDHSGSPNRTSISWPSEIMDRRIERYGIF